MWVVSLLLLTAGAALAVYLRVVWPWCMGWGTTVMEQCIALPGDELAPRNEMTSTRAISIAAPPAAVWPWMAQVGDGRAGWYGRAGPRLHRRSVPHAPGAPENGIRPELQPLRVGDAVSLSRRHGITLRVSRVDPPRLLVLQAPQTRGVASAAFVWSWVLLDDGDGGTRLLVRSRSHPVPGTWPRAMQHAMALGHFILERRMLLGLKANAESTFRVRAA